MYFFIGDRETGRLWLHHFQKTYGISRGSHFGTKFSHPRCGRTPPRILRHFRELTSPRSCYEKCTPGRRHNPSPPPEMTGATTYDILLQNAIFLFYMLACIYVVDMLAWKQFGNTEMSIKKVGRRWCRTGLIVVWQPVMVSIGMLSSWHCTCSRWYKAFFVTLAKSLPLLWERILWKGIVKYCATCSSPEGPVNAISCWARAVNRPPKKN